MLGAVPVLDALVAAGFTHVVWIPDSHLGTWDAALVRDNRLTLLRPCREGEAIGLAAGLMLGGKRPLVAIQCTGFFEAGDAVRNVAHDLKLPLKLLVGVRSWQKRATTADNCPRFSEPFARAFDLPVAWFDPFAADAADRVASAIATFASSPQAAVLFWGE